MLEAIRRGQPDPATLPDLDGSWMRYEDPCQQFRDMLEAVGGRAVPISSIDDLPGQLDRLPAYTDAQQVCSMIPGVPRANVSLDEIDDPHQLCDLDFAIAPAEFGVAENGALWVDARQLKHRVVYFIAQHLALVVPADQMVHNMHEAYGRLRFDNAGFGVFISGPSKTADIEQSLVIGAHGARSLTAFLVG